MLADSLGLVFDSDIRYVYASDGSVSGNNFVGGLVGDGRQTDIRNAYVSGVNVSGKDNVGGLFGDGRQTDIRNAYASGGSVAGNDFVGGLVGDGRQADIRNAYAATGLVDGNTGNVGGLIGLADTRTTINAAYWDNQTTEQPASSRNLGEGKTTTELQSPTGFTGIYASWGTFWCNPDTGDQMTNSTQPPGFNRIWDLGSSTQYPALNCMPGGLSAQGR